MQVDCCVTMQVDCCVTMQVDCYVTMHWLLCYLYQVCTYFAVRYMLCTTQRQASTLSSLITLGSQADPLLTVNTTAMLSQWHRIFFPLHHGPYRATAAMIGTSSFSEMEIPFHEGAMLIGTSGHGKSLCIPRYLMHLSCRLLRRMLGE